MVPVTALTPERVTVTFGMPASPASLTPLPLASSNTVPPVPTSGTWANVYPVAAVAAPRTMFVTLWLAALAVPAAVPAVSLPAWLAGAVGGVSVSVYVPAARPANEKFPWASVVVVSGVVRPPPVRVRVTPVMPVSGPLAVPELSKSRITRPARLAGASRASSGSNRRRGRRGASRVRDMGIRGSVGRRRLREAGGGRDGARFVPGGVQL